MKRRVEDQEPIFASLQQQSRHPPFQSIAESFQHQALAPAPTVIEAAPENMQPSTGIQYSLPQGYQVCCCELVVQLSLNLTFTQCYIPYLYGHPWPKFFLVDSSLHVCDMNLIILLYIMGFIRCPIIRIGNWVTGLSEIKPINTVLRYREIRRIYKPLRTNAKKVVLILTQLVNLDQQENNTFEIFYIYFS